VSTHWQDEILHSGQLQNHQLAISVGDAETQLRAALGYFDQNGITMPQGFDSKTGRVSLTLFAKPCADT